MRWNLMGSLMKDARAREELDLGKRNLLRNDELSVEESLD